MGKKLKITDRWDGNIFSVIGNTRRELKRAGRRDLAERVTKEATASDSYHEALSVCFRALEEAGFEVC